MGADREGAHESGIGGYGNYVAGDYFRCETNGSKIRLASGGGPGNKGADYSAQQSRTDCADSRHHSKFVLRRQHLFRAGLFDKLSVRLHGTDDVEFSPEYHRGQSFEGIARSTDGQYA